ncbi:MAG TPA: PEP-CTERM sorting domain-containing protein [Aquabacterium sp.]|uniref:PEP-CTERM sorting domain-containing protein n=1 Tax=Aquabacterium sp. TaxID=1872578 RepID=UPI002E37BB34|nr:PEP-CTERM sorting domain-containing protein [Aquabacterium sp.]HEX5373742.1 PEP-CTERM sorting domain-containing protein [Aquabacterium sp.]
MTFSIKHVAAGVAAMALSIAAHAAPFVVDAAANSSSGGTGASTISLLAGQSFSVTVSATDLWNAGPIPRWSNADGLIVNLLATGSDESGFAAGTPIGAPFALYTQAGHTAAYGALVGRIGSGSFFTVGTNYSGVAATSGTLQLFYWDSNNGDNSDFITANVTAVPESGTLAMALAGLGVLGFLGRRRQA